MGMWVFDVIFTITSKEGFFLTFLAFIILVLNFYKSIVFFLRTLRFFFLIF